MLGKDLYRRNPSVFVAYFGNQFLLNQKRQGFVGPVGKELRVEGSEFQGFRFRARRVFQALYDPSLPQTQACVTQHWVPWNLLGFGFSQ